MFNYTNTIFALLLLVLFIGTNLELLKDQPNPWLLALYFTGIVSYIYLIVISITPTSYIANNSYVQNVFNIVIEAGMYDPKAGVSSKSSPFMCSALLRTKQSGLITNRECKCALNSIQVYLNSKHTTLYIKLLRSSLPNKPEDLLAIYKDWENRPVLAN